MNIIEKNHELMTSKLSKREQTRRKQIEDTHKIKEDLFAKDEGLEYFTVTFAERKIDIEDLLNVTENVVLSELAEHFDCVGKLIQHLQKYVSDSTLFLTEFKIRHCQETLTNLLHKLHDQETKFMPKKKFGFKNKKKVTTEIIKPIIIENHKPKDIDKVDGVKNNSSYKPILSWNENMFGWQLKQNETLILNSEEINMKDVTLNSLESCIVIIKGTPSTLHVSNLSNCTIISGPVTTSIFAENCNSCKFVIACQQLRLHSSKNLDIYLHVTSRAILEDCCDIEFAPFNYTYKGMDKDFLMAGLDQSVNNWTDVGDFNWLANEQSPNWKIMDLDKRIVDWSVLIL